MKRPFPVYRSDTITRTNIERTKAELGPNVRNPEAIASYIAGNIGYEGKLQIVPDKRRKRLIARCKRLCEAK